jgi:hypothetical protein
VRDVVLSPRLLEELRDYCRRANPKPRTFLFPGRGHTKEVDADKERRNDLLYGQIEDDSDTE